MATPRTILLLVLGVPTALWVGLFEVLPRFNHAMWKRRLMAAKLPTWEGHQRIGSAPECPCCLRKGRSLSGFSIRCLKLSANSLVHSARCFGEALESLLYQLETSSKTLRLGLGCWFGVVLRSRGRIWRCSCPTENTSDLKSSIPKGIL